MQLQEKRNADDTDLESAFLNISLTYSELPSRESGDVESDMDNDKCSPILKILNVSSELLLFGQLFQGGSSITNNLEQTLLSAPLPFTWSFVPAAEPWQLVDGEHFTAPIEPVPAAGQYAPSELYMFPKPAEQTQWTEELVPTKSPIDDVDALKAGPVQKRRRRPNSNPILKGSNKYGRSGNLRCQLCRSWKLKVAIFCCV
jgi:hypothetical protein